MVLGLVMAEAAHVHAMAAGCAQLAPASLRSRCKYQEPATGMPRQQGVLTLDLQMGAVYA